MKRMLVMSALAGLFAGDAIAAGLEKSVTWSGKEAGYAAAGVGRVTGSQSVFFNPAGLATGGDFSLNFSPSWVMLEGAIASSTRLEETNHNFSPIGGVTLSHRLTDRFGLGVGAYVAGGSKAIYDSVDLSVDEPNVTFRPRIATDLKILEYTIGGAFEVSPGFRLGASWRIVEASGGLSTIKKSANGAQYLYTDVSGAKQTKYNGFRLGAQYEAPEGAWGLGAAFRNSVSFNAEGEGRGSATVIAGNLTVPQTVSRTRIALDFPWALSFGGHVQATEALRLLAAADFVKYSKNQQIGVAGTFAGNPLPNIPLNWKDMWNIRFGGEYTGFSALTLRAGYSLTTQVTSATDARATLTPPGTGHLFTLGAGTALTRNLDLDGALEYAFNSATGSMTAAPPAPQTREILAGVSSEYKARTTAIHTGLTYRF